MIGLLLSLSLLLCPRALIAAPPEAPTPPQEAALRVANRYSPGDQFAWSFASADVPIGYHVFRYEGPIDVAGVSAHRFSEWTSLKAGLPVETLMAGELITDDRGQALRHVLEVAVGESYSRVDVSFLDAVAQVTIFQGGAARTMAIDVRTPLWHQANNMIGAFELLLALNPVGEEQLSRFELFSSNALTALDYKVWWVEEATEADLPGAATILKDSLGELLTVDSDGHLLSLEVKAQQLLITRTDEELPLFELSPPPSLPIREDFHAEEVRIDRDGVSLAGTLTRLKTHQGRRPAVVFLSGSGPQDRDGFSQGIDTGTHEVLDALVEQGFTVLRFDDRGVGQSTGPTDGMALVDLVTDARTCVDFLLAHPAIDPERVAIIGHSEGGIVAPIVALQRPRVAALVLMASTGRPLPEVMLDQNALALTQAGIVGTERAQALQILRERFALLASDEPLTADDIEPEFLPLLTNRAWFRQHARHDPLETLARVKCPVLIIQGGMDFQVSPEKDAQLLLDTLDESGHEDHALELLPALDHLFKRVEGDVSTLADYFTRRPVDAEFHQIVGHWLATRLALED